VILLDHRAAAALRDAARRGETGAEVSLDLGRSRERVGLAGDAVTLPDGQTVPVGALEAVVDAPESVFTVLDGEPEKVTWFSAETNKVYTLRATGGWPALEISGILMHRIKDTDPRADAASKVAAIAPLRGRVLETCCGLGYSAIHAARTADRVTVFEIDPNVLDMARLNPYSAPLFEEGGTIEVRQESVVDAIRDIADAAFDAILHDPPTLAVAGELYGDAFYRQLYRVLRPGGRLFHYTGDPGSRSRGQDLPGRVKQRLSALGFTRVRREPEALGVSARKPGAGAGGR
jgi:predicted methyltransferase